MRICKVNNYAAPARDAQGSQRVLEALARQFKKDGHEVFLLLKKDSVCDFGTLVDEIPSDIDIVHYHGGFPYEYGHNHNFKWVTTSHGGAEPEYSSRLQEIKKSIDHIIFVSDFCAKMYSSNCFIHTCINEDDFVFSDKKDDYFLWMAGTDWGEGKGLLTSIMLAKKLGFKLKIAGSGNNKEIIQEIKINCSSKIEYLGFVNGKQKAELLSRAKALLMVGSILDACPATNIEALASGTPVIARNIGSHPEIVKEDVGFVCKNNLEIIKAIIGIDKINPFKCRQYFEENFKIEKIAEQYIGAYNKMIEFGSVL